MKRFIQYLNSSVLIKIASLNSVSLLTRIVGGLLTSRAIAHFIGPEGMALIGNLRNFLHSIQSIATLGLYNGVVKYISEFKSNALELGKTLSTAFYLQFIATVVVSILCFLNADTINNIIFPEYNDYVYIIKLLALVLPFYSLNMFLFSIMNGFSKFKILIIINIIGQILGVSVNLILIYNNRIDGALISVVISESLLFLITLVSIVGQRSLMPFIRFKRVKFSTIKKLSSYSIMALFSAMVLPFVAITNPSL